MLDIIDPMNVGKTFVERNERRKFQRFFITSYFLNTQTTVKSRDTGAKAGLLQSSLKHTLSFFTLT